MTFILFCNGSKFLIKNAFYINCVLFKLFIILTVLTNTNQKILHEILKHPSYFKLKLVSHYYRNNYVAFETTNNKKCLAITCRCKLDLKYRNKLVIIIKLL